MDEKDRKPAEGDSPGEESSGKDSEEKKPEE